MTCRNTIKTAMDEVRSDFEMPALSKCRKAQLILLMKTFVPRTTTTELAELTNDEMIRTLSTLQKAMLEQVVAAVPAAHVSAPAPPKFMAKKKHSSTAASATTPQATTQPATITLEDALSKLLSTPLAELEMTAEELGSMVDLVPPDTRRRIAMKIQLLRATYHVVQTTPMTTSRATSSKQSEDEDKCTN